MAARAGMSAECKVWLVWPAGWKATVTALMDKFARVIQAVADENVHAPTANGDDSGRGTESENVSMDLFVPRTNLRSTASHERAKIRMQFHKVRPVTGPSPAAIPVRCLLTFHDCLCSMRMLSRLAASCALPVLCCLNAFVICAVKRLRTPSADLGEAVHSAPDDCLFKIVANLHHKRKAVSPTL